MKMWQSDAVQEALISAFRRFHTFRGDSLRSWLARVVVNACYDEMRKKRRQHSVPLEQYNAEGDEIETSYWLVDAQADPELQFETTELEGAIQRSLNKLPPIYRLMLVLVDIEGLSYEEAAMAAHVPVGTVKSRLARARLQMQKSLQAAPENYCLLLTGWNCLFRFDPEPFAELRLMEPGLHGLVLVAPSWR